MVLILQFRTDKSLEHEQECFDKYLLGIEHEYLSIFDKKLQSIKPKSLLKKYKKVIMGGSGQLLLSRRNDQTKRALRTLKPIMDYVLENDFPTLGVCFGNQLIGEFLGGNIGTDELQAEAGIQQVRFSDVGRKDLIFRELQNPLYVAMGHEDSILELPLAVKQLAYSDKCPYQAFKYKNNIYGVQFHVELDDSDLAERLSMYGQYDNYNLGYNVPDIVHGPKVLNNFVTM